MATATGKTVKQLAEEIAATLLKQQCGFFIAALVLRIMCEVEDGLVTINDRPIYRTTGYKKHDAKWGQICEEIHQLVESKP